MPKWGILKIGNTMVRISTLKKFFVLLVVQSLLLQPVIMAGGTSRTEHKLSRARINRPKKPADKPAVTQSPPTPVAPIIQQATQKTPAKTVPVAKDDVDTAETRQARSIGTRKEPKSGFEKSVETYTAKIKNTYGLREQGVKPLADAIQKINNLPKHTNHEILAQVKKAIDPLKNVNAGNQHALKSEAQQHLGFAVLLRASMPLGHQAKEIICETLHKLDNHISYWREQKHHQISYFLHKNPQKWFGTKKQKKEIEDNLHLLTDVRNVDLDRLAKLAEHESLFVQDASLKDQYEWLAKYLSIISNICYSSQAKLEGVIADEATRFEKLLEHVSYMLGRVSFYEPNVARALGGAKKPGHFTRNWIAYTGATIGAVAFAWYAHRNQEKFHNWFNTDVKGGATHAWASLSEKGKDLYEAVIGKADAAPAVDLDQAKRDLGGELNNTQRNIGQMQVRLLVAEQRLRNDVQPRLNGAQQNLQQDLLNGVEPNQARALCTAAVDAYRQRRNLLLLDGLVEEIPLNAGVILNGADYNLMPFANLKPAIQRVLDIAIQDFRRITAHFNIPPAGVPQVPVAGWVGTVAGDAARAHAQDILNNDVAAYRVRIPALAGITGNIADLGNAYAALYQVAGRDLVGVGAGLVGDMNQVIGTAADLIHDLRDMIGAVGNTIGQVPRVENVNGVNVHVIQRDANGQPVLDANGAQIPVMAPGPVQAVVAQGFDMAKTGNQILNQNRATLIVAALIPAGLAVGGTLWGASKTYKLLKHKPNFCPMREALIDIGHLLNEEGIAKEAAQDKLDQGKILYLVWKLKRESDNVPALVRDQFLADVSRLGRSELESGKRVWTADKKMRIIDLMYRTYDFLNPAYIAA